MNNLISLFTRIADDEAAFDELFYTWSPGVRQIVKKYIGEDPAVSEIVHDVFLKIWLKRETLNTIENPAAWLTRVTANACLNHIRNTTHHTSLLPAREKSTAPDAEHLLQVKYLQQVLRRGVNKLPGRRRIIYIMSKEQHLDRKQIALKLNISEHTVKNHLAASLQFLQEYLAKHGGVYIPLLLIMSFT